MPMQTMLLVWFQTSSMEAILSFAYSDIFGLCYSSFCMYYIKRSWTYQLFYTRGRRRKIIKIYGISLVLYPYYLQFYFASFIPMSFSMSCKPIPALVYKIVPIQNSHRYKLFFEEMDVLMLLYSSIFY